MCMSDGCTRLQARCSWQPSPTAGAGQGTRPALSRHVAVAEICHSCNELHWEAVCVVLAATCGKQDSRALQAFQRGACIS